MKELKRILTVTAFVFAISFFANGSIFNANAQVIGESGGDDCDKKLAKCLRNPGYVCELLDPVDPSQDCSTPNGWSWDS